MEYESQLRFEGSSYLVILNYAVEKCDLWFESNF